jgi:hypothetical protein
VSDFFNSEFVSVEIPVPEGRKTRSFSNVLYAEIRKQELDKEIRVVMRKDRVFLSRREQAVADE